MSSASRTTPVRVAVDARLTPGLWGGVEQALLRLAEELVRQQDDAIDLVFLVNPGRAAWLRHAVGERARVVEAFGASRGSYGRLLRTLPRLRRALSRTAAVLRPQRDRGVVVPRSDGTLESLGIDVVHFPTQAAFLTEVPSIYQPWDLQHLHLPQFFTAEERHRREVLFRAYCSQARIVAVASAWQARDLVRQYDLSEDRIYVTRAGVGEAMDDAADARAVSETKARLDLPPEFLLYPANTWPHKNHIGLLRAIARLRDGGGPRVCLVSCGERTEFFQKIAQEIQTLGLAQDVRFLGRVESADLRCLYRLARGLVFPSLFEGFGLPLVEAFSMGLPVACSDRTSLPEVAGDAAILFDPSDDLAVASAVRRLWTDAVLRRSLAERGRQRLTRFSWEKSARIYRVLYKRIAGRSLTADETSVVDAATFVEGA